MSVYTTAEIWLCVDAQGDVGQGRDQASALEDYTDQIGSVEDSNGFRLVCCKVRVPLPETAVVELTAIAPELAPPSAE